MTPACIPKGRPLPGRLYTHVNRRRATAHNLHPAEPTCSGPPERGAGVSRAAAAASPTAASRAFASALCTCRGQGG